MSVISVHINNVYASHIGLVGELLNLNVNIVSPTANKTFNYHTTNYDMYYSSMLTNLATYADTLYEIQYLIYLLQHDIPYYSSNPASTTLTISIPSGLTISQTESYFYSQLNLNNVTQNLSSTPTSATISYVIQLLYGRTATAQEISYYLEIHVNLFSLLMILRLNSEGISHGYQTYFVNYFKPLKYVLPTYAAPKCAVLFSGFCRTFQQQAQSHQVLVNNPYIDIFIHTWSDMGIRIEFDRAQTNSTILTSTYNPASLRIDNVGVTDFRQFSLNSMISPIFLYKGQRPTDDPAKYVNANLYSLAQAFGLMTAFETANNFEYDVVFRFKFDFNITKFDFVALSEQIIPQEYDAYIRDNVEFTDESSGDSSDTEIVDSNIVATNDHERSAVWFPSKAGDDHYFHGGGCLRCDIDGNLANHFSGQHANDLTDDFFYGCRSSMITACQLNSNAYSIYSSYQSRNLSRIASNNIPYKSQYGQYYFVDQKDDCSVDNDIVCYHPNRLLKQALSNTICRSTSNVDGNIIDIFYLSSDISQY